MFLLDARSTRLDLTDHQRMRAVAREVHGDRFEGLVEHMVTAAERAAHLPAGTLDTAWMAPQPQATPRRTPPEVFFGTRSVFVLAPAGKRVDAWEVRHRDRRSTLDEFCATLTDAVEAAGVRGDDEDPVIEWRARTVSSDDDTTDLAREVERPPVMSPTADRAAAHALADDDARSFIEDLVRSGSSITDFDDSPMARYQSVGELHRQGLIEREYLIVCRQDHRTLGRVTDMDDGTRQSILQLSCPTCGRRFDEELVRQVHAPSRAAVDLIEGGRWRATWALSLLADHGVDERTVTQMSGAGGNGVALRVDTLHSRLVVELPAVEFGMQHAYALLRRLGRQHSEFGLVLATEPVTDEAYQYINDHAGRAHGPLISVLEGARAVTDGVGEALDEWSMIAVRRLADDLVDAAGIDVGAVIEAWMRQEQAATSDAGGYGREGDVGADDATVTELSPALGQ